MRPSFSRYLCPLCDRKVGLTPWDRFVMHGYSKDTSPCPSSGLRLRTVVGKERVKWLKARVASETK